MSRKLVLLLLAAVFAVSGCTVAMALHGEETPDLRKLNVGSTRGEVEKMLGSPVRTVPGCEAGYRTDTYEYEVGNDPSPGRAIFHGVMDVLTLATWEMQGTPLEAKFGEKYRIQIEYGADDRVTKFCCPTPARIATKQIETSNQCFPHAQPSDSQSDPPPAVAPPQSS